MSIFITQLIFIKDGQEETFNEFEDIAIPLIPKYNGRLLYRARTSNDEIVETQIGNPYEIHIVEFNREEDFNNFMKDETRKSFLHLKEKSIREVMLIKGTKL